MEILSSSKSDLPSQVEERDSRILDVTLEMREFANKKYRHFHELWIQYDDGLILHSILLNFWILIVIF